jgi:hypothetical protein
MRRALVIAAVLALSVPGSAAAELAIGSRSAEEGWIVTVSAQAIGLGPVEVSVGSLRPARGWGHQWLEHDLILTNTGRRNVSFGDTWRADLMGPSGHPVLIGDPDGRCGFQAVRPVRAACILPLIYVALRPGRSETRVATLWRGVRRMEPLEAGTYVLRQPLRYRLGRRPPAEREGRTAMIRLVYRVEAGA